MKTREKILDQARKLFNEQGIRNTSTRQIAASMSISPGNLHYHFKHTEDIVMSLFEQLVHWYDKTIQSMQNMPIEQVSDIVPVLDLIYYKMDAFRFLFIHFVEISLWVPKMGDDYKKLMSRREDQLEDWLKKLEQQNVLSKLSDRTREELIKKILIIADFWISHNALTKQYKGEKARQDFVATVLSIFTPYIKIQG
jgi:AcrR family transcriptional regulator